MIDENNILYSNEYLRDSFDALCEEDIIPMSSIDSTPDEIEYQQWCQYMQNHESLLERLKMRNRNV